MLKKSALSLSQKYRDKNYHLSEEERLAYVETRMPATCQVIKKCLLEVGKIDTLLDLGAGPGTSAFACQELFPDIKKCYLVEKESISIGQKLTASFPFVEWQNSDITKMNTFPSVDLWLLSYVANEIPFSSLEKLLLLWKNGPSRLLLIIEPGTPEGFKRISLVRELFLSLGLFILAPCPHGNKCPIKAPDWCHFSQNVPRSSLHRRLKEGSLGHEDEKYSYLIVSKKASTEREFTGLVMAGQKIESDAVTNPVNSRKSFARVLRHPIRRSGHVILSLCTTDGLLERTISKKDKELYKIARKLKWGSSFQTDVDKKIKL